MSKIVIKVENVSKQYRLGSVGTGSMKDDIKRWRYKMMGKEDPFAQIGDLNDRTVGGGGDYVWALKDINFDIKKGDAVGIIGRNGAGKSTLLKILSRTTTPSKGSIKMRGRIASLLEVGTGFHGELTGKENIFLNGAIMGMKKYEIRRRLDEIIEFSGVEKYLDTPVKRYSSGMYVRLAFAVAAHLESDILIVDEVLAVGDAEFQKKCLGKLGDVSKGEGKTILFVSHNMASIRNLCQSAILMNNGSISFVGDVDTATKNYLRSNIKSSLSTSYNKPEIEGNLVELLEARLLDKNDNEKGDFDSDEEIVIRLKFVKNAQVPNAKGYLVIKNNTDDVFIESDTFDFLPNILEKLEIGKHVIDLTIPARILPNGRFIVYLNFTSNSALFDTNLDSPNEIMEFNVMDTFTQRGANRKAYTNCIIKWENKTAYVKQ